MNILIDECLPWFVVFPSNRLPVVKQCEDMLHAALDSISSGGFVRLENPAVC